MAKEPTEATTCGVISCPAVTDDISVRLTLLWKGLDTLTLSVHAYPRSLVRQLPACTWNTPHVTAKGPTVSSSRGVTRSGHMEVRLALRGVVNCKGPTARPRLQMLPRGMWRMIRTGVRDSWILSALITSCETFSLQLSSFRSDDYNDMCLCVRACVCVAMVLFNQVTVARP